MFKKYFIGDAFIYHLISFLGLMMLGTGFIETWAIIRLYKKGISTTATITWVDQVISRSSYNPNIQYHVKYFIANPDTGNTKLFQEKMIYGRLTHVQGEKLVEGDTIQITYNPSNPDEIQCKLPLFKHLANIRVWGIWVLGLILLLVGQVFRIINQKKLSHEGKYSQ